ncbi:MAG: xanthine dehydrogenase family protein subunit M [Pseudomonadota bacterium]
MYKFDYHTPDSVDTASQLLGDLEEAKLVAGGMTLLPTMKLRLAQPDHLIDMNAIGGLDGIRATSDGVEIGAMARHADVAASQVVRGQIPALAELASLIGDPQVRHRGTMGGSVANNDPAADYPAGVLALNATLRTTRREIRADDFFTDMFETALAEDEILLSCTFAKPARAAYVKFPNPASRYAIVGVFVADFAGSVRVAVTGAAGCVFRATDFENALGESFVPEALDGLSVDGSEFNEDLHASGEYRAHLVGVMAKRAVAAAAQ